MNTTDSNPVTELRGDEGGLWQVITQGSSHYFDLDAGTVTRVPGTTASPTVNDQSRPIRTIDTLKVGARGRWTMSTDGWDDLVDFFWHVSSVVSEIRPVDHIPSPEAGGAVPD